MTSPFVHRLEVPEGLSASLLKEKSRIDDLIKTCEHVQVGSRHSTTGIALTMARDRHDEHLVAAEKNLINFSKLNSTPKFLHFVDAIFPGMSITPSGNFLYPRDGFMGWHTNANEPFKRCYITLVDEVGCSGFRYFNRDTQEIVDDVDDEPIIIRVFDTPRPPLEFWHAVYSNTNRYSFGFKIIDNL